MTDLLDTVSHYCSIIHARVFVSVYLRDLATASKIEPKICLTQGYQITQACQALYLLDEIVIQIKPDQWWEAP